MKRFKGRTGLLAAGLLICFQANTQLLHEGFENAALGPVDSVDHVTGWEIDRLSGIGVDFNIVGDEVSGGNKAFKIDVRTVSGTNPGEIYLANWKNPVPVPGDSVLEISFYAKASRFGQKIRLDVKNGGSWPNLASKEISLSTEYKRYSFDFFSFTPQEIGIYMNFAYRKYDEYWIDDIRFAMKEIPPAPGFDSIYKRSDVIFTVTQASDVYQKFNADMIAWGWLPTPLTASKISSWKGTVRQVQASGLRYQGRTEVDAGWKNMINYDPDGFLESVVTTLSGKKVTAPWFEGREYNGHPAYWFCTNSTGFQDFLRHQVTVLVSGDVDCIMFDGQVGTPLPVKQAGGCFCSTCVAGFRSYMGENYTIHQLAEMGISDIESFDYGVFLRNKGWSESNYIHNSRMDNPSIPLFGDFQEYQYRGLNRLTAELSQLADRLAGKRVVFSSSSNPDQHFRSVFVPEVDYYTQELHLKASSLRVPYTPVLNYAMADALDKGLDLTGIPQWDWNVIFAKDRPALVRSWISQAYAYGARFIVPIWNWAGDFDFYQGNHAEYEYMYDFIKGHSSLFDGYDLSAQVGLILPYEGLRFGTSVIDYSIMKLMEQNIPFEMVISGGKWWDKKIDEFDLKRFPALALTSDMKYLDLKEKALVDRYGTKSAGAVDTTTLFSILPRQINVSAGNKKVNVVPRENLESPEFPYVIHLVNMQYNESEIAMDTVKDFTVSFKNTLFNREIIEATLYRPGKSSMNLVMGSIEGGFSVEIPELVNWGLIRMKSFPTRELSFRIYGKNKDGKVVLLPGAEIQTDRNYVSTGPQGEVSIRQGPGPAPYSIIRKGYASAEGNFTFINDTTIIDTLDQITYTVGMQVTDASSGEMLSNARVFLGEQEGSSDGEGMVQFPDVAYGSYAMEVFKEQYTTFRVADLEIYSDTLLTISLARKSYAIKFHLVDSVSGTDLQGVSVYFNQKERLTQSDGTATLSTSFGEYDYSMTYEDYETIRGNLTVQADTTLELKMRRIQATVSLRVTNNGASVYKAIVNLNGETRETNSVGMVGFEDVPVYVDLEYTIDKEGFQQYAGSIYLQGDTTVQVNISGVGMDQRIYKEIHLYPNPVKEELIIDSPGGELFVELMDITGRILISRQLTGELPKLRVNDLPGGTYLLKIVAADSEIGIFRIIKE